MEIETENSEVVGREWTFGRILKASSPVLASIGLLMGVFVPFYTMQTDRFNSIESNQAQMRVEILEALSRNDDDNERRIDSVIKKSLNDDIQILEAREEKDRTQVEEHLLTTFQREYTSM